MSRAGESRVKALVIVGSPHAKGKSEKLADAICAALAEHGAESEVFSLASHRIGWCVNCGACLKTGDCAIKGDDWVGLCSKFESADLVFLVAPVYFAGPSACLKAMLDRCQMYWARKYVVKSRVPEKRPCHLLVVGDGGDPFGSSPLETICTSALNCANLRIEGNILRFIGNEYDLGRVSQLVFCALENLGKGEA